MSSSYSSSLRVELIGSGDQAGTWGATTDNNFAFIFDTAIAGYQAVAITSTSQLLTSLNGPTASAALNQSIYAMLKFTGASAATNIFAPPVSKQYIIWNNSGYAITIYNSAVINVIPSPITTTGITIANGDKVMVWSDGTNFYDVKSNAVTGTVAIANGGTGQVTATAAFNALAPSQASASGKYLKSDGTNTAWDALDISTGDITGTLPIANGGTGQTTQQAALNALAGTQTNNRVLRSDGTNTTLSQLALATDVTGTLAVANGGTGVTTSTGTGNIVLSTSPTISTPTISTYGNIKALFETATVTVAAPSATTNFDVITQAVQYYTGNVTNNFTFNIRGDGSTTLNSILAIGQSVTIVLLVTNGSVAYRPSVFQIDGSGITPKWQTATTPSFGNPNSIDVYTFAIIKTASATYTVLASQTQYA
jgi:hypothetical protein